MDSQDEYERWAQEAEAAADRAKSADERWAHLEIAKVWRDLAERFRAKNDNA